MACAHVILQSGSKVVPHDSKRDLPLDIVQKHFFSSNIELVLLLHQLLMMLTQLIYIPILAIGWNAKYVGSSKKEKTEFSNRVISHGSAPNFGPDMMQFT